MTAGDSPYLDDRNRVASYLRKNPVLSEAERVMGGELMYCSACLAFQTQTVTIPFAGDRVQRVDASEYGPLPPMPTRSPYLLRYSCNGCGSVHWGAMYRACVEALVRAEGIREASLDKAVRRLEERAASGTPTPALAGLPVDVLHGLRAIGNAAVHFTKTGVGERSHLRASAALAASQVVALLVNPRRRADWHEDDAAQYIAQAVASLNVASK